MTAISPDRIPIKNRAGNDASRGEKRRFWPSIDLRGPEMALKGGNDFLARCAGIVTIIGQSVGRQVAALPLGGRVKLNAWDDHLELIKAMPVAITSARNKMPLEVAPFFPYLTRYGVVVNATGPINAPNPIPTN